MLKLNGSTGYLEYPGKIVSGFPFTMFGWATRDATGAAMFLLSQSQSNADRYVAAWLDANATSSYANLRNPGNSNSATKSSTNIAATPVPFMAVFVSTTQIKWFIEAGDTGTSQSIAMLDDITNHDTVVVGAWHYNGNAANFFTNGSIGEAHFFTGDRSADFATLAGGAKPELTTGWVDGWTLQTYDAGGTYASIGGTRTLTAVGGVSASSATHPVSRTASGPTINTQPTNQTVTTPATATFTVSATASSGSLTYQWQRNGSDISGATSASYTTPATSVSGGSANNGDAYRCNVTDSNGTTASSAATLTVNAAASKSSVNFFYRKGNGNV